MADNSTVARPYAKAIFEMARDSSSLQCWDSLLKLLAITVQDEAFIKFVKNPSVTAEQTLELLSSIVDSYHISIKQTLITSFLNLLIENHRLLVLTEIYLQYIQLRENYERNIEVHVVSYAPLTKLQEEKLVARLTARLNRNVRLNVEIDKSLKGGAVIKAGHLVFDASVGSQIKKLSAVLVS